MATLTLKKKKKAVALTPPTNKPPNPAKPAKPAKPSTPVEPVEAVQDKMDRLNQRLLHASSVWRDYLPLEIGVHKKLFARYESDFSHSAIRKLIMVHVNEAVYLNHIVLGGDRFSIDGEVTGQINDKEKASALKVMGDDAST